MSDSIEDRWHSLLARGVPESREADAESSLRMLFGVSLAGRPYFAVIAAEKPKYPELPSMIEVRLGKRAADGRWALTLELHAQGLTDAFISLVSDLATRSAAAESEREALDIFLETLSEWRELLTARVERLSESALRGLIAELWFGFESRAHGHAAAEAAQAWAGPLGGVQDFQFPSPGYRYEVKSVRPGRTSVEISSEEQLDGGNIQLVVVTVEDTASPDDNITLPNLVKTIRSGLMSADRAEFNRRFVRQAVDLDDPWYSEHAYAIRGLRIYDAGEDFPALRRSRLPKEISRTSYRLDVQYLQQFLVVEMDYAHRSGACDG